jgi:putative ABC transport system permease protein
MLKVALRGLIARKFRLALTATAVLLGVMFVTTTYVLTDTLEESFQRVFEQSLSDVDVVVRAAPVGDDDDRGRMPEAVVDQVREIDGVAAANGFVQGYAQLVGRDGDAVDKGVSSAGVTFVGGRERGPMLLVDDGGTRSRAPRGPDEVVVDIDTARVAGFRVGDTVDVLSAGPRRTFDLVGVFRLGSAETGPFAFLAFDQRTSQEIAAASDRLDAVYVRGDPGLSVRELRRSLRTGLGSEYDVLDPEQIVQNDTQDVGEFVNLLTGLLLGFAALGVVVGAFIIFNTFTILVTQRTHELGLLRAMGASRRQVITSVIVEAGVVGALASAAGVLLGIVVARLLMSLVDSLGFSIPSGDVVVEPRTVVLAVGVGLLVTVGAALWPAVRASRIPPVAAIGDLPEARVETFRRRTIVGLLLLGVAVPVLLVGVTRAQQAEDALDELPMVGLGALLLFFGIVVLLAVFARPLARWFGVPVRAAAGISGAIARGNAMRNPRRTAATASALVIGLALVAMVAVLGESAKAQIDASGSNLRAELALDTTAFTGFSPEVVQRLEELPEVKSAVGFHFGRIPINGQQERIIGMNGSGLADAYDLQLTPGSTAEIGIDEILVSREEATEFGWALGDTVSLSFPLGERRVRVVGVYGAEDVSFGTPVFVSRELFRTSVPEADLDYRAYVTIAPGVSVRSAKAAIEREIGRDFPNIEVLTQDEVRDAEADLVDQFLGVLIALLFLSEAIAVLGIVNTLALSVYERTHEIGMLRAVGMTRRQLRRSVRWESVIIAAIGGTVGLALGLVWAWAFTSALETEDLFLLSVPLGRIVLLALLSLVAGAVAAVIPAWRASRLEIFEAIARE